MIQLVVDASVAAKWFLKEPDSALAERLLRNNLALQAPALLITELANIFWKRCLHSGLPSAAWAEVIAELPSLAAVSHSDAGLHDRSFELAIQYRHPVYDCLYLALAVQLGCNVVTADRRFASAFSSGAMAGRVQLLEEWAADQA
jgi:predicted nucleic acid-binding protein